MENVEQKEKRKEKKKLYSIGMCDRLKVYNGRVFVLF